MKLNALILACTASLLASPARAEVRINFDFFYDSLAPYGEWVDTDRYGNVWQPTGVDRDWSPYTDGYWSYTDAGWTWVSYEDFGGITYHYGRWVQLDEVGWCWVPGYDWGPAWVSWRKSDDYVGWAPLPPEARWEVKVGISSWSDTHYDVGPGWYSFCHSRDFGAPVIRHVLVPRTRNVTIIDVTNNITNITYNYDRGYVFNGGLDYDYIAPRCSHSLPALKLVQNTTTNIFVNGNRGNVFINSQQGNALYVAAPPRAAGNWSVPTRRPVVAKTLVVPAVSRGWAGLDKDGVRDKLLVKMRSEVAGATPDSQPARAFRADSIASVPKKADPTLPRPSVLKANANRGSDDRTDGPSVLKKPITHPGVPEIDGKDVAKDAIRPAPAPGNGQDILKKPVSRPEISANPPGRADAPAILKKPVVRPEPPDRDPARRPAESATVLKKPRDADRRDLEPQRPPVIERPASAPKDDGGLRKKIAEQADREKTDSADRARGAAMAREKSNQERDAQEARSRELSKQRDAEDTRRMTVEKQRRSAEADDARRSQAEAQRAAEANSQRKQAEALDRQRQAAESEKMQRRQAESQRAAEDNTRRQQAAAIDKQRRSAEQDNARRSQEESARRSAAAAADNQRRMQAEMSRRGSDEARQRQSDMARQQQQQAEAARRQAAQQQPRPQIQRPQPQPSQPSSNRSLSPEEQALLKKKRS